MFLGSKKVSITKGIVTLQIFWHDFLIPPRENELEIIQPKLTKMYRNESKKVSSDLETSFCTYAYEIPRCQYFLCFRYHKTACTLWNHF